MAGNSFYARGVEIYNAGKVRNFRVEEMENGIWAITAQVKGSGRQVYGVELTYDREMDELVDSYCECPAYYNYDNLCKHCAAVLLHFVDYEVQNPLFFMDNLQEMGQKPPAVSRQPETTPALKGILMKKFMERTFPVISHWYFQNVCVEGCFYVSKAYGGHGGIFLWKKSGFSAYEGGFFGRVAGIPRVYSELGEEQ